MAFLRNSRSSYRRIRNRFNPCKSSFRDNVGHNSRLRHGLPMSVQKLQRPSVDGHDLLLDCVKRFSKVGMIYITYN